MASMQIRVLSDNEIEGIHGASLGILRNTGVLIHHQEVPLDEGMARKLDRIVSAAKRELGG